MGFRKSSADAEMESIAVLTRLVWIPGIKPVIVPVAIPKIMKRIISISIFKKLL